MLEWLFAASGAGFALCVMLFIIVSLWENLRKRNPNRHCFYCEHSGKADGTLRCYLFRDDSLGDPEHCTLAMPKCNGKYFHKREDPGFIG